MLDFDIVRRALKALRRLAGQFKYGGLGELHALAGEALEALDRIEKLDPGPIDPITKSALQMIVEQLESCEYECEAGPLENNTVFVALKELIQ